MGKAGRIIKTLIKVLGRLSRRLTQRNTTGVVRKLGRARRNFEAVIKAPGRLSRRLAQWNTTGVVRKF